MHRRIHSYGLTFMHGSAIGKEYAGMQITTTGQTTTANGNLMLMLTLTRCITCQTKSIDPVSPVQLLTIQ